MWRTNPADREREAPSKPFQESSESVSGVKRDRRRLTCDSLLLPHRSLANLAIIPTEMEVVVPESFAHLYETNPDRPVVKVPEPVLRQVAKSVEKVTPRHRLLAENMVRIMKKSYGVGLAAPQVGVSERIIVVAPEGKAIVLFNPVITAQSGKEIGEEGCLSIPGLYGDVERFSEIEVEGLDIKGRPVAYAMDGFAARVVQHEVDHLDGVLFIDKVDPATLHWMEPAHERRRG